MACRLTEAAKVCAVYADDAQKLTEQRDRLALTLSQVHRAHECRDGTYHGSPLHTKVETLLHLIT